MRVHAHHAPGGPRFTLAAETSADAAYMDHLARIGFMDDSRSVGEWSGRVYRPLERRFASLRWRVRRDAGAAFATMEYALNRDAAGLGLKH